MDRKLRVEIGSDAYASCFAHALSTEHEEIMGLLVGTFESSSKSPNEVVCKIFLSMVLIRSDKRKDRVEIPPELMAGVSAEVDKIKGQIGIDDLQVVGWYHSHPHITALPSHVDLRTQLNYQMLDPNFVGLIFSVFNADQKTNVCSEQVCCFQSTGDNRQKLVPLRVVASHELSVSDMQTATTSSQLDNDAIQAAVKKHAAHAVDTIFQLYLKEENDAFRRFDGAFDDARTSGGATSSTSSTNKSDGVSTTANFTRRVANGAAYSAAVAKIVGYCHHNQDEALKMKKRLNDAKVETLKTYRDALKALMEEKEARDRGERQMVD